MSTECNERFGCHKRWYWGCGNHQSQISNSISPRSSVNAVGETKIGNDWLTALVLLGELRITVMVNIFSFPGNMSTHQFLIVTQDMPWHAETLTANFSLQHFFRASINQISSYLCQLVSNWHGLLHRIHLFFIGEYNPYWTLIQSKLESGLGLAGWFVVFSEWINLMLNHVIKLILIPNTNLM